MTRAVNVVLLGTFLLSATAYSSPDVISLATSLAAMGANDNVTWGQLGADGAAIANSFSATSANLDVITGSFSTVSGMVATAGSSWGPATGAFANNDALIWSFDNGTSSGTGPLSIGFPAGFGAGAAIQADAPGQFTAQIQLYSGLTSLGTESITSDVSGDAIFIGAVDTVANVTSAVFSLTASGSSADTANRLGDFTIDTLSLQNPVFLTPEPGTIFLLGGGLTVLGLGLRRRIPRQ
jgi:glucose dehydrogenase